MANSDCTQFRPHHLRPDKCRNCFGDKSRHQQITSNDTQQATSENKKQSSTMMNANDDDSTAGCNNSKQELLDDLKRCQEDRVRLKESNEQNSVILREKNQLIDELKNEVENLKEQLSKRQQLEGEGKGKGDEQYQKENEGLKNELRLIRSRLESAEEQRDLARDELRAIEREMEEMHDNFKEEESEQFEQLKQELDLATKNCKILQIRLNKAERQYGQLEQVKSMLEHQLEEWTNRQRPSEQSLLNNQQLNTSGFAQMGEDFVKISSREYDQLLRDLNDTIEREKDLQEQIKYSQEEAQMKSDRLQAVEAENEVLLSKVNKLTLANSRLRSNPMRCASLERNSTADESTTTTNSSSSTITNQQVVNTTSGGNQLDTCSLIQQNEQLKLALDLAQSESERLRHKCQEVLGLAEQRETMLKEYEQKIAQLEEEIASIHLNSSSVSNIKSSGANNNAHETIAKLELECRHLRTRLVHSERECKQLRVELSEFKPVSSTGDHPRLSALGHSLSMEGNPPPVEQAKLREIVRQLREECNSLKKQNKELEVKVEQFGVNQNIGGTKMESDLLEKLKHQLETSESELAKARSRLVELDLEYTRLQRQHKRMLQETATLASNQTTTGSDDFVRKVRLPPEEKRDSMNRQELRQILKDLEVEADELIARLKARKDSLPVVMDSSDTNSQSQSESQVGGGNNSLSNEEQVKSLRRLLDQERLLSNNLKLDVSQLEKDKLELQTAVQMLERERVVMEEELDRMRQLNSELDANFEELKRNHRSVSNRLKDTQLNNDKLHEELNQLKSHFQKNSSTHTSGSGSGEEIVTEQQDGKNSPTQASGQDMLLLMRDLSELKVKNGYLMRQLEMAREDTARQLDDLRETAEVQQKRAVELAQIELKERHLIESQQLRDELQEVKQKLVQSQRQVTRNEEEASGERDRWRSMERDWRRDKSQWQQKLEQLEAQLSIERRSNEYKSKEWESMVRDKERELISVQDKYVQLERDLKRMQNKFSLLEESSESKQKNLLRDLDIKKRELTDLMALNQKREDEYYEQCKRFNNEKTTLMEALESLRRSYDEKLVELKSSRELLSLRQEQAYKERVQSQEQIEQLGDQLLRMSEFEGQVKLLRQQLQVNERQVEQLKRDQVQLKEERTRLKGKCEELERRCHRYEKQELITKTSNISSSTSFLKNAFHSTQHQQQQQQKSSSNRKQIAATADADDESEDHLASATNSRLVQHQNSADSSTADQKSHSLMVEKLTSKINDQRHLINMLKQQNEELQLEVKQLRLIQSSDKVRWQGRVAQLQSRLNACEEKLLFETQLLNRDTFESGRRKLEVQWAEERQMSLETIQQQQSHNELLTRDLKKLGQAHELLRLQSKQLESHNNKLSRRLIEYQQQQFSQNNNSSSNKELEACLSRQDQLTQLNTKLVALMKEEAKPLIETVTKMVAALDVSEPSKQQQSVEPEAAAGSSAQSLAEVKQVDPLLLNSTHRPLMTAAGGSLERRSSPTATGESLSQPDLISTSKPTTKSTSPSRFARLLGKHQPKATAATTPATETSIEALDSTTSGKVGAKSAQPAAGSKTIKRVRVKSSSLGITLTEKKQLKRHLEQLNSAIDSLNNELKLAQQPATASARLSGLWVPQSTLLKQQDSSSSSRGIRASSSPVEESRVTSSSQPDTPTSLRSERPHSLSFQQQQHLRDRDTNSDSAGSATPSRVHWQLQNLDSSDLDSNKSYSAGKTTATNSYRRFPQSTPSSYGASLTDYESESSLASYDDLSTTYHPFTNRRAFTSGAESDTCVGQGKTLSGTKIKTSGTKKRTLRNRLTNTLRNISRSITGLASDSETESMDGGGSMVRGGRSLDSRKGPIKGGRMKQQQQLIDIDDDNNSNDADRETSTVREIRV